MNTPRTRLKHIRQSVRLVWTSAPGWTVLQGLLVLVQGVLPVATLFLTRQVVDAASAFLGQAPGAREPWSLLALAPWVAAVAVAGWLCRAFSSLVVAAQVEVVADTVQDALQAKSVDVDLAYYETSSYHDQMRLAQAEATGRATSIVRNLVQLGSGSIMLVSVASVLAGTQGLLLPLLLLAAVPGAVARLDNARRWNRWRMQQNTTSRYAGYLHVLLTSLPFAKEIRLFGLADELRGQSRRLRDRLRHSRLILLRRRAAAEIAADAVSAGVLVAGLGLVYARLQTGGATLGDLALLYGGFQKGRGAFAGVLGGLASLYEDSLFIAHFYRFMELPRRIQSPSTPRPVPQSLKHGIHFEHVSFRYPGTDRDVLREINLEIRPGEHVALVGENGSGKTTLVKLLCRLYDPTAGRILLEGIDLREFAPDELRAAYSGVFQDFARYQMSAEENIRLGHVTVPPGDARVVAAAKRAGADEIISRLPTGYETRLGRLFFGGVELSEGQWQRVALARALLRSAPILLLDEPTSALDARAERQLLDTILTEARDQILLMVSHRFSTVQAADRIVMLTEGQVTETGVHEQLIQANGGYAQLFTKCSRGPG
ncbi:MAG: ABC transporter ATP-binding protein [Kiritimatiellae bacterium]|nr:ABC transporter ATP-binding protein [Kiritimatiellia bacterium]